LVVHLKADGTFALIVSFSVLLRISDCHFMSNGIDVFPKIAISALAMRGLVVFA